MILRNLQWSGSSLGNLLLRKDWHAMMVFASFQRPGTIKVESLWICDTNKLWYLRFTHRIVMSLMSAPQAIFLHYFVESRWSETYTQAQLFSVYNHIQNIAESYAQILQLLRAGLKFRPYTVLIIKYLITIFTHPLERGEENHLRNGLKNCLENTTCLQCREFLVRGLIAVNATNRHSSQMFFKVFYLFFLEIGRQFRRKVQLWLWGFYIPIWLDATNMMEQPQYT